MKYIVIAVEICLMQNGLMMNAPISFYSAVLKRFKEMRELQASRGKDDRQKREQLRHEKELQRFAQLYPLM
jgi:hypothetical protein